MQLWSMLPIQKRYPRGRTRLCPACAAPYDDFDGCLCLVCSRCDTIFCALCQTVSSSWNTGHAHVAECRLNTQRPEYFWPSQMFDAWRCNMRYRRLYKHVSALTPVAAAQVALQIARTSYWGVCIGVITRLWWRHVPIVKLITALKMKVSS